MNNITKLLGLLVSGLILVALVSISKGKSGEPAKESSKRTDDKAPATEITLENIKKMSLAELHRALDRYGPDCGNEKFRRAVLGRVDDFVRKKKKGEENYINPAVRPDVIEFYQKQVSLGLDALEKMKITEGVACLKLYSSSWVIKSSKNVAVLDFSEGPCRTIYSLPEDDKQKINKNWRKFHFTDKQRKQLARLADIYIASHHHFDHTSYSLAKEMTALGKTVIVTKQTKKLWKQKNISFADKVKTVEDYDKTYTEGEISYHIFEGMQYMKWLNKERYQPDPKGHHAENNSTILRLGGVTVLHMGDNNKAGALRWLAERKKEGWDVDIFFYLAKCQKRGEIRKLWPKAFLTMTHTPEFTHALYGHVRYRKWCKYTPVWGEIFLFKKTAPVKKTPAPRPMIIGFSVRDFGAKGDGVHDDTEAFQRAIIAAGKGLAPSTPDVFRTKTVLVPPGNYRITKPLVIDARRNRRKGPHAGLKIIGAGAPFRLWHEKGPTGNPRTDTEIFWDGPEHGVLFDIWGSLRVTIEDCLLNGRGKTDALISVNSPRGWGSGNHVFRNVHMVNSKVGFDCGNKSYINSADMSFYDVGWADCEIGFRTNSEQNLNYNFVRCGGVTTGVLFDFPKGGSATFLLASTYGVGTFLRVGNGGINAGVFTILGLRLDGTKHQGKRTVWIDARGETQITISGSQSGCTNLLRLTDEQKRNFEQFNTPLFILGPHANVLVQGSMISGNIARLTGDPKQLPTWIQFDNCRFRVKSDPRTMIQTDAASGYELRNCVVMLDTGKPLMIKYKRKAPLQEAGP